MAVKSSIRVQKKMHRVLSVMALIAILLAACGGPTQVVPPTPTSKPDWRTKIVQVPLPHKGCFTATYPSLQWQEVACVTPPNVDEDPGPASGGLVPETVGGGDSGDYAAVRPTTGLISSATGSFLHVTGVTSERDSINGLADSYSLQLNTNNFTTTASVCTAHPSCTGFQQFVFRNTSGRAFMEYWLIAYNATCPTGWTTHSLNGRTDCGLNSSAMPFGSQPIGNLASLNLTGTATAGSTDTVYIGTASSMAASNQDSVFNLASGWTDAEFNIFGNGSFSQANFNVGSTIDVETIIHYGETAAPGCMRESFTGETNNLTLVGAPSFSTAPSAPAIEFTESNIPGGTPASCATASGVGETHLRTFSGLFYDFQATGDFLLAQTNNFAVQTRQVSGAPTWPNAAINQAVATQMGHTRVALCAAPARLVVDGNAAELADGQTLALPSGVHVFRTGNVYLVTDQSGNSLRAVMIGTWIDVTVGLGTWPTQVRGLLANANGNVNELEASDGTVLNTPVSFGDLYGRYGESWRVAPADSLLSDCGGKAIESGIPTKPFFARDLPPSLYNSARAICTNAGVKVPALLDACTLDVAVLGNKNAATVYVGAPAPVAVGETGQTNSQESG
jgi:hypothetical protein